MKQMRHRRMNLRNLDSPRTRWWFWPTAAIAGVYMLGKMLNRRQHWD